MKDFNLKKYLAEGKLLKESTPGYDTRKTGEALPTLESVKAAYEDKNSKKEIKEGVWKIGNPDDIRDFIKKIGDIQNEYWDIVGSDSVMNGLDEALSEAKILLDIKMGNVQPEEFDIKWDGRI